MEDARGQHQRPETPGAGRLLAVDCTLFDFDRDRFCGAAARWVSYAADGRTALDVHCDAHRALTDQLIPSSTARADRSEVIRGARFLVPLVLLAVSLATLACASAPRCRQVALPMSWSDGTQSVWTVTACGRVKVSTPANPVAPR